MTVKLSTLALLALTVSPHASAFTPISFHHVTPSQSALHASVVSKFLTQEEAESAVIERFETETPASVGLEDATAIQQPSKTMEKSNKKSHKKRRKHNFAQRSDKLQEEPDLDFFTLHSSNVSHLEKDTPIEDIVKAIKRAQNLHDAHDLATISAFLIDTCDEHWGYGFRGSLLSRLAVAALHMNELDIARKAIDCRRVHERPSMKPHESAAIVRGLMRSQLVEEAWDILEDELRLPLEGLPVDTAEHKDLLRHRAHTLSSIVSRSFYEHKPKAALSTLNKLSELAPSIEQAKMTLGELNMPWDRLVQAAASCENNHEQDVVNTMMAFPCITDQE